MTTPIFIPEQFLSEVQEASIKESALETFARGETMDGVLARLYQTHVPAIEKLYAVLAKEEPSLVNFLSAKRHLFETKKWFDSIVAVFRTFYAGNPDLSRWDAKIIEADAALLDYLKRIDAFLPAARDAVKATFLADYHAPLQSAYRELEKITEHHIARSNEDVELQESWKEFLELSKRRLEVFAQIALSQRELWLDALLQTCRSMYVTGFKNLPFALLYTWKGSMYVVMDVIGQMLGQGESKTVSRIVYLQTGKIFALVKPKTAFKDLEDEEATFLRNRNFYQSWRESEFVLSLQGTEGILVIHERLVFEVQDVRQLFLVEDRYEDGTLETYLSNVIQDPNKQGAFDEATTLSFALQLLTCLARIHAEGIIHRDIKLDNVLLDLSDPSYKKVAICDFNLACKTQEIDVQKGWGFSPLYVAPEYIEKYIQIEQLGVDPLVSVTSAKLDVWSMGAVFYVLFFQEKLPWEIAISNPEELIKIFNMICALKEPWIPEKFTSHRFYPLIQKMLRIDPKERISSREALIECQNIRPLA